MVAKALGEQGAVDSLASDLAKDGLLAVCEGGGDLGMAVPGLASFLTFLSRPQTLVGRQRGASWAAPNPRLIQHLLPVPIHLGRSHTALWKSSGLD